MEISLETDGATKDEEGSVLPLDIVLRVLELLSDADLCRASLTCKQWATLANEFFKTRVVSRWKFAEGHNSSLQQLQQAGAWQKLYAYRHKMDLEIQECLARMVMPQHWEESAERFRSWGLDCMDALLRAAHTRGPLHAGTRYWARQALEQMQVARCAAQVAQLPEGAAVAAGAPRSQQQQAPPTPSPSARQAASASAGAATTAADSSATAGPSPPRAVAEWEALETAALAICQVHHPGSDMGEVRAKLDALADEARARMRAAGVSSDSEALQILHQLLFGERHPDHEQQQGQHEGVDDHEQQQGHGHDDGAEDEPPAAGLVGFAPPAGYGLGLQGNAADYYDPRNSLLADVLQRRTGIPITLCLVHALVGARLGLRVHLVNMPMHVVNCVRLRRCERKSERAGGGGGSGGGHGGGVWDSRRVPESRSEEEEQKEEEEEEAEEVFVDAFNGTTMDWQRLTDFMASLGIPSLPRSRLLPMTPRGTASRMLGNLAGVYGGRQYRNLQRLAAVQELAAAAAPNAPTPLQERMRVSLQLNRFQDARRCLRAILDVLGQQQELHASGAGGSGLAVGRMAMMNEDFDRLEAEYIAEVIAPKRRTAAVQYRVGDIVQHRRFGYRGVICDWDPECRRDERWMTHMGVGALPGGRHQPFYSLLVDTRDAPFDNTYVPHCELQLVQATAAAAAAAAAAPSGPPEDVATRSDDGDDGTEGDGGAADGIGSTAAGRRADVEIRHPECGRYFEGLAPGSARYRPNAYLRQRFPDDD